MRQRRWVGAFVALGGAGALAAQSPPPEETPRDVRPVAGLLAAAPTAVLATGGMRVTVALPDPARGFYRGTRFDWSGMIEEVALGATRFYGPWFDGVAPNVRDYVDDGRSLIVGPRTAATGPAEEFISRDGEPVPGYADAAPGGTFVKIGVGRLRKDARPYSAFNGYDIVDGGRWTVRRAADRITFVQRLAPDAGGYGYDYEKTIRLTPGGGMTIEHRLRNIGARRIATQVYNHNFARFDGAAIGTGVVVRFPFAMNGPLSAPDLARFDGREVRYTAPLAAGAHVQLPAQPLTSAAPSGPFQVTGANGASITMQADAPLIRATLWSIRRTVAVEPFIAIDVAPGAEQRWSWRYTFTPATPR